MKADSVLQQDVIAELEWEPSVDAAHIGVEVHDGIVTLAGHVDSYGEKWNAEQATLRVAGVRGLAVEMDVALPGLSQRTDADIARAAENAMLWMTALPEGAIQVMVEGGWVSLSGTVDWHYQRQNAIESVRHLMGVTGVSDQIGIRPKASSDSIKTDIEAALKRRTQSDAASISVKVADAEVTLAGKVHSLSERTLANDTAWRATGVRNVVDKITVAF